MTVSANDFGTAIPARPADVLRCMIVEYAIRLFGLILFFVVATMDFKPAWMVLIAFGVFFLGFTPLSANPLRRRHGFPLKTWWDDQKFERFAHTVLPRRSWVMVRAGLGAAITSLGLALAVTGYVLKDVQGWIVFGTGASLVLVGVFGTSRLIGPPYGVKE